MKHILQNCIKYCTSMYHILIFFIRNCKCVIYIYVHFNSSTNITTFHRKLIPYTMHQILESCIRFGTANLKDKMKLYCIPDMHYSIQQIQYRIMMYSCTREQYFPADLLWISVSFKIWKELGKNGFHLYFRATFSHLHKMNFYEKHIFYQLPH